eukprot:9464335-Pyramimonas_sp.AAC.1
MQEVWRYARGGESAALAGDICTGVSGLAPIGWPEASRAGWRIAVMTCQNMRGIAYGPLPGHQQSVPRAELYALAQALRHGTAPMYTRTYCYGFVEGLQQGRKLSIHPRTPNRDIWELLWHDLDDHGGISSAIQFYFVRSYQTVAEGNPDKKVNDNADVAAKRGLAMHA